MSSPHYLVFQVDIEGEGGIPASMVSAPEALAAYGGKYLALTPSPRRIEGEGESPSFMAIVD